MEIHSLFTPSTMAIVGVSLSNDRHPANVIYNKNLLRYPVRVYPVNPKGGTLHGEKLYSSLAEIEESVDLVVIAVRAEMVKEVIAQCIALKVKGAIVISGGFAESGRLDLQESIAEIAQDASFPFIGPNCLGIYTPGKVDTFFLPSERIIHPHRGNVSIVSQSGGMLVDLLVKFSEEGIGLASATSIGNKAVVREEQMLSYLAQDPSTRVIAFYIEGFDRLEGRRFVKAAQSCPKPVVVVKAGKTSDGGRAVASHTASMAGDYQIFSEVLAQHGIAEAKNEQELLAFCESLSYYQHETVSQVAILTSSGGHGAIAVDTCLEHGLKVPGFSKQEQVELINSFSINIQQIASVDNPVDLTGSALEQDFINATSVLAEMKNNDCILILLLPYLPGISSDLGARLSQIRKKTGKPIVAYVPHVEKYRMLFEGFELNQVPVSSSIEGAVLMAEALKRRRP